MLQIRLVHVGAKQLGLDEDTRRDLQLAVTGKASLSDMTAAEVGAVVDALKARGFRPVGRGRPAAERADVRYAHVLWRLLVQAGAVQVPGRAGLNAFARARFGAHWGAEPIDVDALRDWRQIRDLIDALKAMCDRHGVRTER